MKKCGIYKLSNTLDGRIYIGSSMNMDKRKKEHFYQFKKGTHNNKHLQNFVNKYSISNINFEIIEECLQENIISREQYYIDFLKPEFNICKTAYSGLGLKHSEETKKIISEARKGNTDWKGKKHKQESKDLISKAHLGKKLSQKTKDKIAKIHKGNTYNLGKTHSEDAKLKMSLKKQNMTKEKRLQCAERARGNKNNLGKKRSEESKLKSKLSHLGKKVNENTRLKMIEAQKIRRNKEKTTCDYQN